MENPPYLTESNGQGFDEQGQPVLVTHPPEPEDTFEGACLDGGLDRFSAALANKIHNRFLTRVERVRESEIYLQAAEMTRMILALLSQTKVGQTPEYLAILACLGPDQTLEEIASATGISRQAIHYHVKKLRPILTPSALVET